MANRNFWAAMLAMALVFGMAVVGCDDGSQEVEKVDNTISSVSISLGSGNDTPKVGRELTTTVRNTRGISVSGVSYQWKRANSQYSTFVNISNATSNRYTPTTEDTGRYIKVEARNSDTTYPVESSIVGPVDANQVAKPTANPAGGDVVPGQEITLISANATIYYTLDGTTPTSSSSSYSDYSKPKITGSCTLKAIATRSGMVDSEVLSVSYTVVAAPSFSSVTSTASIFDSSIYSVAYGDYRFVAGGSGKIAYSSNGTTWTASTGNSSFIVYGIAYGGQFVAVGSNGVINYSSNGTSWSNVTDTTFGTSSIRDVAYGGGRYVAVGENGRIAYSTNGTSWTAATNSTYTSTIYGITYGAGKFVAVGADGKMAYSTNGTSWTAVTDSTLTSTIRGITYGGSSGNEKFIAVGGSSLAYSTDGVTWTKVSQYLSYGTYFNRITWGGNKYVAVADAGVMYFSPDGISWAKIDGGKGAGKSQMDDFDAFLFTSSINDIAYGGGKFLVVGSKIDPDSSILFPTATGEMAISN